VQEVSGANLKHGNSRTDTIRKEIPETFTAYGRSTYGKIQFDAIWTALYRDGCVLLLQTIVVQSDDPSIAKEMRNRHLAWVRCVLE
ncbi:MAG: hypothetical protein AAF581_18935, partial [Planctomycetota bacterium]